MGRVTQGPIIERLSDYFFADEDKCKEIFSQAEYSRLIRLRDLHRQILHFPMWPDRDYMKWLHDVYHIQDRQAQKDVSDLRTVIGNFSSVNKEWERWQLSQMLRRNMKDADEAGDFNAVARLSKNYIVLMQLDKDTPPKLDLDRIYPMPTEPTNDVTVLNLPPVDEQALISRLRRKYKVPAMENAAYEEVPDAGEEDPFGLSRMEIEKHPGVTEKQTADE